ncbi:hypothetical protein ABPG75_008841 [Micractinium tetrahymenae]
MPLSFHLALLLILINAPIPLPGAAAAGSSNEGHILRSLHQLLSTAAPALTTHLEGWRHDSGLPHCSWEGVDCDDAGHVTAIRIVDEATAGNGALAPAGTAGTAPLPDELAQLTWLKELTLELEQGTAPALQPGLPAAWLAGTGAFPRLEQLSLTLHTASAQPLPGVHPGALPRLSNLTLFFPRLRSSLPPSWGASPDALPALESLDLVLDVAGPLPAAWGAAGFRRLRHLALVASSAGTTLWVERVQRGLPASWAAPGSFPALQNVTLSRLNLMGSLPAAWTEPGGLPALEELNLGTNLLTGPLPPRLFVAHPRLHTLQLTSNTFSGTLPPEWGKSQVNALVLPHNPALTGPLFPPAWLLPGRMQQLQLLQLGSPGLTGTLPASLPWPALTTLDLSGSGLVGTIPGSWCNKSAAPPSLRQLRLFDTQADSRLPDCSAFGKGAALPPGLQATGDNDCKDSFHMLSRPQLWVDISKGYHAPAPWQHAPLLLLLACAAAAAALAAAAGLVVRRRQRLARVAAKGCQQQQAQTERGREAARLLGGSGGSAVDAGEGAIGLQLGGQHERLATDDGGELIILGRGSQAVVCLGRLHGAAVAVKVVELPPGLDVGAVWREASLLRRCTHRRIIPLFGVAVQGPLLLLAMQLMPGGSLRAALRHPDLRRRLRWEAGGRWVAADVAEALQFMHSRGVMHSDLKSNNVLLSADLRASLADLGMARAVGSRAVSVAGLTCTHAAPEQLLGQRCTLAADLYAFGVLLIELTTQREGRSRLCWQLPRAPQDCPQAVLELIQQCLQEDPQRRPTAAEALRRLQQVEAG